MKCQFLQTRFAKILLFCAVSGIFFSAFASMTQAQTTTFASFTQIGATRPFVFTNNNPIASGNFNTATGGASVRFFYDETVISGLNAALIGQQTATLTMTSSTTVPATNTGGNLDQPIQIITIAIIRNTAAPVGVGIGTRTNLLTITVTTGLPSLSGNGGSATLSASTPGQNVVFSSDFLNFGGTTSRNFGISLSGASTALALGANNFLSNIAFNGTGTFASNPVPTTNVVTAAAVTIGGRVLTPTGRGLRNAQVTLTEADGTTRTILTGNAGSFSFNDVTIPQTIIVSVRSKSYRFTPQIISPDADFTGLDFTGLGR